jgi:DNA-binding NarL/FixJ family response regulator
MRTSNVVLLISDHPDRSRDLAYRLDSLCGCRMIGFDDQRNLTTPFAAVVTDVGFRDPATIERTRRLLSQPRAMRAPIVAILRDNNHHERVQATALGATAILPANASVGDISAALGPAIRSRTAEFAPAGSLSPAQNVELAMSQFGDVFAAAMHGDTIDRTDVENATTSVMAAIVLQKLDFFAVGVCP